MPGDRARELVVEQQHDRLGRDVARAAGRERGAAEAADRRALVFGEQGRDDLERFLQATLGPLLEWDRARSADLTRTLLTFLDCGQSTSTASQALHIHPNTLRQRLERISSLLPGWQEPTRGLEIHLALRLAALQSGS